MINGLVFRSALCANAHIFDPVSTKASVFSLHLLARRLLLRIHRLSDHRINRRHLLLTPFLDKSISHLQQDFNIDGCLHQASADALLRDHRFCVLDRQLLAILRGLGTPGFADNAEIVEVGGEAGSGVEV